MFYRSAGSGRPLLLLHGFPFSSEIFWPWLEEPPAGVRLICPDLRGFGQSPMQPGPSTMEAFASDTLKLLDQLAIPTALVGGVSMGGYAAMALARLDPSRVSGLVLLDTQSSADDAEGKTRREAVAKDVESNGVAGLVSTMLPRLFAEGVSPQVRARVEAMMRAQRPEAVAAASRGMGQREDSRDILARLDAPALVLVGEHDVVTGPDKAKAMVDVMSNATLEVVAGVGHLAHLEAPAAVTQALTRWLSKLA